MQDQEDQDYKVADEKNKTKTARFFVVGICLCSSLGQSDNTCPFITLSSEGQFYGRWWWMWRAVKNGSNSNKKSKNIFFKIMGRFIWAFLSCETNSHLMPFFSTKLVPHFLRSMSPMLLFSNSVKNKVQLRSFCICIKHFQKAKDQNFVQWKLFYFLHHISCDI